MRSVDELVALGTKDSSDKIPSLNRCACESISTSSSDMEVTENPNPTVTPPPCKISKSSK